VSKEQEGRDLNMSSQVQQYMRETLKKLYLKNRSENHPCGSFMRQSDQPTMIRELLINIENIKDFQNSQEG
jgi:hypothetical protein